MMPQYLLRYKRVKVKGECLNFPCRQVLEA